VEQDFSQVMATLDERQTSSRTHSQIGIISAVLAAVAAKDLDSVVHLFHPDAVMTITGIPDLEGTTRGPGNIIEALVRNFETVTEQSPVIEAIVEHENYVITRIRETGKLRRTGEAYQGRAILWFTFEKGQILQLDEVVSFSPLPNP
jgi:ketosteroid isomerase-like protein